MRDTPIISLTSGSFRFYGGVFPVYLTLKENSTFYISVSKGTYDYGGYYNMTMIEVSCPGLDTCSEAGTINGLPFVSLLRIDECMIPYVLSWFVLSLQVTAESNVFASGEFRGSPASICRPTLGSRTQWYFLPDSLAEGRCFSVFLYAEFSSFLGILSSSEERSCGGLSCLYQNSYFNGFARFHASVSVAFTACASSSNICYDLLTFRIPVAGIHCRWWRQSVLVWRVHLNRRRGRLHLGGNKYKLQ